MNDAEKLALKARLAYLLLTNVSREASEDLKKSLNVNMGNKASGLDPNSHDQIELARETVRKLRKSSCSEDGFNLENFFENAENQEKSTAILVLVNLFAQAARSIGREEFRKFAPDEILKDPAHKLFMQRQTPISDLLRSWEP